MTCAICLEDREDLVIWECGKNMFCKTCSLEWIKTKVKESIRPECIHGCLDHVVSFEFVETLVEEEEILERAKYIYLESEISIKDRIYCFSCAFPLNKENQEKKVNCKKCLNDTCIHCKSSWSNDHICQSKDEENFLKAIKESGYQICTCGLIIERIESCNKIFCKCKRVFCYKCNTDYFHEGQSYFKVCLCNDYDEDVLFVAYVDKILELLNQETNNPNNFDYNSFKIQFDGLKELFANYKSNLYNKEEKSNLQKKITLQIMKVATIEFSINILHETNDLTIIQKLKKLYKIIQENRKLKKEVLYLRQQFTSTYFELNKAKRKIQELEKEIKKPRMMPPMPMLPMLPLFPMLQPINMEQAFTLTQENLPKI